MSSEPPEAGTIRPDADVASPTRSTAETLRSKVTKAATLEVVGFGVGQALRLGANLILTRLLFPEAFGLSAMVHLILYGLQMLTDVGLTPALVRSPRGDEPVFLDTVWSIKVLRGLFLWILASALAWPASLLFREPMLLLIIPVGSASSFIQGLCSMRVMTLRRHVKPLPVITLDLATQFLSLVVMVGLALVGFGIWSLVIGSLVAVAANSGFSYTLPGTHSERFRIEPQARSELLHFGRWIYASSVLTFAAGRGDQLFLGRLIGAAGLGVYNIALALAEVPETVIRRVIESALYPAYSRIHNERPRDFSRVYYRTRLVLDAYAHTALGGLIAVGPWIVHLMYDPRYHAASTMLQLLALRASVMTLCSPCEIALMSQGQSKYGFRRNAAVALTTFVAMPVGYALGGATGLVCGTVVARAAAIPVLWPAARRSGMLRVDRELLFLVFLACGYCLGRVVLLVLPRL